MGEKYKVENEEDEKKWEKLIQYYRNKNNTKPRE